MPTIAVRCLMALAFTLTLASAAAAQSAGSGQAGSSNQRDALMGWVFIDSSPRGAAVEQDGQRLGVTPLLLEAAAGEAVVRLVHRDFSPTTLRVTARAGVVTKAFATLSGEPSLPSASPALPTPAMADASPEEPAPQSTPESIFPQSVDDDLKPIPEVATDDPLAALVAPLPWEAAVADVPSPMLVAIFQYPPTSRDAVEKAVATYREGLPTDAVNARRSFVRSADVQRFDSVFRGAEVRAGSRVSEQMDVAADLLTEAEGRAESASRLYFALQAARVLGEIDRMSEADDQERRVALAERIASTIRSNLSVDTPAMRVARSAAADVLAKAYAERGRFYDQAAREAELDARKAVNEKTRAEREAVIARQRAETAPARTPARIRRRLYQEAEAAEQEAKRAAERVTEAAEAEVAALAAAQAPATASRNAIDDAIVEYLALAEWQIAAGYPEQALNAVRAAREFRRYIDGDLDDVDAMQRRAQAAIVDRNRRLDELVGGR